MRRFNVASDATGTPQSLVSTGYKTQLVGTAVNTNLRRGKLIEIAIGPLSNPVTQDCNIIYAVQRQTVSGSGGGSPTVVWVGVQEAGSDTPVPGSAWNANNTTEGTYANRLWTKFLNQHSGFIWYSPDDTGLPWPAIHANGLACMAKGATTDYTGTVAWEVKFEE